MKQKLLSTTDAAKILGISRIAVFRKIQRGTLNAMMIGGTYALTLAAVQSERIKMHNRDKAIERRMKNSR